MRVAVPALIQGRVTQADTREAFVRHPRTRYAAELLGINVLDGEVVARLADGMVTARVGGALLTVPAPGPGARVRVLLHPHDITLSRNAPESSARNALAGTIAELVPEPPSGERVRVLLDTDPPLAAQVTRQAAEALALAPGQRVWAAFKATAVNVLDG